MGTSREHAARRALQTLGQERFVSFARAIRNDTRCFAVTLLNEELDGGNSVDVVFFTGHECGFELSVIPVGPLRFHIEFGCDAGPLAGDGGEWEGPCRTIHVFST
jgi:hypothetical protein